MVNHINAFFNTNLVECDGARTSYLEAAGNILLNPVRYLTKGRTYMVYRTNGEFEKLGGFFLDEQQRRTFTKVVLAIIAFIPSILLGTFVKGLALLSSSARERHGFAVIHNTLLDRKEIQLNSQEARKFNPYCQKIKNLVIRGNGQPIGSDDIFVVINNEITERLILMNTHINGAVRGFGKGPAEVLASRNFEQGATCIYSPADAEIENEPVQVLRPINNLTGNDDEERAICIETSGKKNWEKVTCRTPADLKQFIENFKTEKAAKAKDQIARYFARHPNGLISLNCGQEGLAEYLVNTLEAALSAPLPSKHWFFSEKIRRVFVVHQTEVQ